MQSTVPTSGLFQDIVASSNDAIVTKTLDGVVTSWNPAAERIFGYPAAEMIGRPMTTIFPRERLGEEAQILARIRAGQRVEHFETVRLRKDGSPIHVSVTISPLRDEHGDIVGASKIARDITERVQAQARERRLLRTAQLFESLVESSDDAIVTKTIQGLVTSWNPAAERIFGYTAAEMIGEPMIRIFPPDRLAEEADILARIGRGERVDHFETVRVRKDGTPVEVSVSISPLRSEDGEIVGAAKIARDISASREAERTLVAERAAAARERQTLEAQLHEQQKIDAIGVLAGGIAHDFNNVLAGILGNASLARSDLDAGRSPLDRLVQITVAAKRSRDLVQQILAFGRRNVQRLGPLDLGRVVDEAAQLLRAMLPTLLELRVRLPHEPVAIVGDATQLFQVVVNLVTNAAHAIGERAGRIDLAVDVVTGRLGGPVTMPALLPGRMAVISVADDGSGMSDETLGKIFEPFFTTKPVGQGTGLGLSVVHGIVASHHGGIAASSTLGRGSRFEVYLPLSGMPIPTERASDDATAGAPARWRVLLVDDDEMAGLVAEQILLRAGHRVDRLNDPQRALERLAAAGGDFDVLVTDHQMPRMSGIELIAAARAICPALPVVLSSGFIDSGIDARSRAAGADEVVLKERLVEDLAAAVDRAAGLRRALT